MLDITKHLVSSDELEIFAEEVKEYVKLQGIGLTENDVNDFIDEKLVVVNESINNKIGKDDVMAITSDEIDSLFTN